MSTSMALSLRNKSFVLRKEDTEQNWLVVDADKQIVGRLATQIATVLMGKAQADLYVACAVRRISSS